jgi:hypothetical protein
MQRPEKEHSMPEPKAPEASPLRAYLDEMIVAADGEVMSRGEAFNRGWRAWRQELQGDSAPDARKRGPTGAHEALLAHPRLDPPGDRILPTIS